MIINLPKIETQWIFRNMVFCKSELPPKTREKPDFGLAQFVLPGGKEKEWTDCVADDLRLFGVTGDWKTAALDPGAWYNTVQEGGCRFMAAWVREEENASNQRQKKREAEEADKVEVAPGVTVASLRRFRTALIGPTQGLPKRRRLCR